jgi:hypothetical protein
VAAGYFAKAAVGRTGRRTSSPEQLGQTPFNRSRVQVGQNVHSNEQIIASAAGGKSASQHSQFGLKLSIAIFP